MMKKLRALWRLMFSACKSDAQLRRQSMEWALRSTQPGEDAEVTIYRADRYLSYWLTGK
jgi:hypothetical protein